LSQSLKEPIRVVLADGAPVVVDGLDAQLRHATDIVIVGRSTHVEDVLALFHDVSPDVILVDYALPGGGAIAVLGVMQLTANGTRSIVFSNLTQSDAVKRVFRAGATGYLLKSDSLENLPEIIRRIRAGNQYLSTGVSQVVLDDLLGQTSARVILTCRQHEILGLIARGQTSPEIAGHLGIRLRTVHTHRARLMKKLGVHTATALVYEARREGLV
jgi:DNA-binding NarL/FixJ family response regulator